MPKPDTLHTDIERLERAVASAIDAFHLAQPELRVEELMLLRKPTPAAACHAHIIARPEALPDPADMAVS